MAGIARRSTVRAADASPQAVPSVVVLGDLILDVTTALREPIAAGTDAPATIRFHQGGSAANTARTLARLGARVSFVGSVGRDAWGSALVRSLRDAGVAVHAPRVPAATARIVVLVATDGERSFATERGAADGLQPGHLQAAWFRRDALHMPAYSLFNPPLRDAAFAAAAFMREAGGLVSVDLASRRPLLARGRQAAQRDLREIAPDLLFANMDEAAALVGGRGRDALLEIAPVVALKQGSSGCLVLVRRGSDVIALAVATRAVEATDTTGAGDAFDAGFLYAWLSASAESRRDPRILRLAALAGHRAAQRHLATGQPELEP